jgi:hypothetical protein
MTILSKDTKVVLKLNLGEQGIRRITLKRLWDEEKNIPSFHTLVSLIRDFAQIHPSGNPSGKCISTGTLGHPNDNLWNNNITYTDEDGDVITISSDEELADAFEQFVTKEPPVLRATVTLSNVTGTTSAISTISTDNTRTNTTNVTNINNNNNLMKLEQLKAQKRDIMRQMAQEPIMAVMTKQKPTPTTTTTTTTTSTTQTDMVATESDASMALKDSNHTASVPIPKGCPSVFIHGRHTCDGCFTTPIIGIRYHAVNLPDYDLCQNCVQNYKGSDIKFKPEQLERDVPLQHRWKQRFAVQPSRNDTIRNPCGMKYDTKTRLKREDIRNMSHDVASNVLNAAIKGVRRVGHEIMEDTAFQEAVRRSLLVSKPSHEETNESLSVNLQEEKKEETELEEKENHHVTIEVESVSEESVAEAEAKDVMSFTTKVDSPTQSVTTANILIEPLDELILREETPQICSKDESTNDSVGVEEDLTDHDGTQCDEAGASILNGEETLNESPRSHGTDVVERGEWQVLDNNGEDITQREFARAAEMLGSALYHSAQTESNMSSLTSVPTIGSSHTNIPPTVLAMWRNELDMLHELGFSDEQRNVEALEYLQAANIGSNCDKKVSVERAISILLNEK